jgi:ribulose-phosphate 3-epimerase
MWKNLTDRVLITPSIIAADLSTLGEKLPGFDPAAVDLLHMDVMDGNFVPNLTIGPGYIKNLMSHTKIPFDVHLMIEKPENSIDSYIAMKPWAITIHYESTRFPSRLLSRIREAGIIAGLTINPATPVDVLYGLIPDFDMALIMSVDPGFFGQAFMPAALDKIRSLKKRIDDSGFADKIAIMADGGINADNIRRIYEAGARIMVAGGAAFKGGDINRNVRDLKKAALGK